MAVFQTERNTGPDYKSWLSLGIIIKLSKEKIAAVSVDAQCRRQEFFFRSSICPFYMMNVFVFVFLVLSLLHMVPCVF